MVDVNCKHCQKIIANFLLYKMILSIKCDTCNEKEAKYKCPICRSPYCSVACCKLHKESSACQPLPSESQIHVDKPLTDRKPTPLYFETNDTVATEKLALLDKNEKLRNLLSNPHLQTLLKAVDSDPNASTSMEAAMQEPIFVEFADLCLRLVEPQPNES